MNREITLPPKRARTQSIMVRLRVVTPIYGGAAKPRQIDDIDVIRPASVRGHLRFWWRALHARDFDDPTALYLAERAIWGAAATSDEGGRSNVEIRITVHRDTLGERDLQSLKMASPDGYVLFPARGQTEGPSEAPRRIPGTEFDLELRLKAGAEYAHQVQDALQAWILFGGYGGRTRRGLGSLTIVGTSPNVTLPAAPTPAAIAKLFARDPFAPQEHSNCVASLGGAKLVTRPATNANDAWFAAIGWLKDFRQGNINLPEPLRARRPGADRKRPSISHWPEADKVRHFSQRGRLPWAHPPQHNTAAAWPRAEFGLPILGQFQKKHRDGKYWEHRNPPATEPKEFELVWYDGNFHNRLASPLILKPLPLTKGQFAAMALWLDRTPPKGYVALRGKPESKAPFGLLTAPGDTVYFPALKNKRSLQEAFFDWIDALGSSPARSPSSNPSNRPHHRGKRR